MLIRGLKFYTILLYLGSTFLCISPSFSADSSHKGINKDNLLFLARQFLNTVAESLNEADAFLAHLDPNDLRRKASFDNFKDGEEVILEMELLKKDLKKNYNDPIIIEEPIMGIKQGYDVMISLTDFVNVARFPIKIDSDKGTAIGWFAKEGQIFNLNLNTKKVKIKNTTFDLLKDEIIVQNNDILVKGETLSKWFDLNLNINLKFQTLKITSKEEWPLQGKIARNQRRNTSSVKNRVKKPFRKEPFKLISTPNVDVSATSTYSSAPGKPAQKTASYYVSTAGDLLGFTNFTQINGTKKEPITQISSTFSRKSNSDNLLGPLKARSFNFNDISSASIPLSGGGGSGRGIIATNKSSSITTDQTTNIEGISKNGWDVEIYQNNQHIGTESINNTASYSFKNVQLYAGDNNFKIIHYGPHGERRTETRLISTSAGGMNNTALYNLSVMQQDLKTYTSTPSNSPDAGKINIAGSLEKTITPNITLRGGLQTSQRNNIRTTNIHTGAFIKSDKTFYNIDSLLTSHNSYILSLGSRKNFGIHRTASNLKYTSKDFLPNSKSPSITEITSSINGPFDIMNQPSYYTLRLNSKKDSSGTVNHKHSLRLATRIKNISASNILNYNANQSPSSSTESTTGSLTFRGFNYGTKWTSLFNYSLLPEDELQTVGLTFSKKLSRDTFSSLALSHTPPTSFTSGAITLSSKKDKYTLGSSLVYDTNNSMKLGMSISSSLMKTPIKDGVYITASGLQNSGALSAFVFLDKNGDGLFNKDDEPLPDMVIEAVQFSRDGITNEDGKAFIPELAADTLTDVVVLESTALEPNWVSGFDGISIRTRPGLTTNINFPIHRGGEIEGYTYVDTNYSKNTRILGNTELSLYNDEGKLILATISAPDGWYLFERVPPGHYWLIADLNEINLDRKIRPPPQEIIIGYEGKILSGNNLYFQEKRNGGYNPAFSFKSVNKPTQPINRARIEKLQNIKGNEVRLKLGPYHSKLALALSWYKFKIRTLPWSFDFDLETPVFSIKPDPKTAEMYITLKPHESLTLKSAQRACQKLLNISFNCSVEVITHYKPEQDTSIARLKKK